jgi:hypothetical protein
MSCGGGGQVKPFLSVSPAIAIITITINIISCLSVNLITEKTSSGVGGSGGNHILLLSRSFNDLITEAVTNNTTTTHLMFVLTFGSLGF